MVGGEGDEWRVSEVRMVDGLAYDWSCLWGGVGRRCRQRGGMKCEGVMQKYRVRSHLQDQHILLGWCPVEVAGLLLGRWFRARGRSYSPTNTVFCSNINHNHQYSATMHPSCD